MVFLGTDMTFIIVLNDMRNMVSMEESKTVIQTSKSGMSGWDRSIRSQASQTKPGKRIRARDGVSELQDNQ